MAAQHYDIYWDLTQRIYREEFDPGYDGDREEEDGIPGTPSSARTTAILGRAATPNTATRIGPNG